MERKGHRAESAARNAHGHDRGELSGRGLEVVRPGDLARLRADQEPVAAARKRSAGHHHLLYPVQLEGELGVLRVAREAEHRIPDRVADRGGSQDRLDATDNLRDPQRARADLPVEEIVVVRVTEAKDDTETGTRVV